MKVVHIAGGCASGSPIRIVNALNKHTKYKASFINTMKQDPRRFFDVGTCWESKREEAIGLIRDADIIHSHGVKVLRQLGPFIKPKVPVLAHLHGYPDSGDLFELKSRQVPTVSILQCPERYLPVSRLLPNLVSPEDKVSESLMEREAVRVFFSPTLKRSAWGLGDDLCRWLTKGSPEVMRALKSIEARSPNGGKPVDIRYVENTSFEECMRIKRSSDIVIDDTVTGSYHLVGLEALAMGIPTLGFVDSRMECLLKSFTGAESIPWINTRLEELESTLQVLVCDGDLRRSLGDASHQWMQKHYREESLIEHFIQAYTDLVNNPQRFSTERFDSAQKKVRWQVEASHHSKYLSRKRKYQRGENLILAAGPVKIPLDSFQESGDCNNLLWHLRISTEDFPFGSWLVENRYRRIDAYSKIFNKAKSEVMLNKYRMALPYAQEARVVDLGSGAGYGAKILKEDGGAKSVIGVDQDMLAVAYAQEVHPFEGVTHLEADALSSGLPGHSFDLVTAIDLIEWVDCDASLIEECIRLLAPGGKLVISGGGFWNKESEAFYKRRYTPRSFKNLLDDRFSSVQYYRQISHGGGCFSGKFVSESARSTSLKEGESLMAVCSL